MLVIPTTITIAAYDDILPLITLQHAFKCIQYFLIIYDIHIKGISKATWIIPRLNERPPSLKWYITLQYQPRRFCKILSVNSEYQFAAANCDTAWRVHCGFKLMSLSQRPNLAAELNFRTCYRECNAFCIGSTFVLIALKVIGHGRIRFWFYRLFVSDVLLLGQHIRNNGNTLYNWDPFFTTRNYISFGYRWLMIYPDICECNYSPIP